MPCAKLRLKSRYWFQIQLKWEIPAQKSNSQKEILFFLKFFPRFLKSILEFIRTVFITYELNVFGLEVELLEIKEILLRSEKIHISITFKLD
jgi:hypothetical protein